MAAATLDSIPFQQKKKKMAFSKIMHSLAELEPINILRMDMHNEVTVRLMTDGH
jgi:hypothetical protein